MGTKEHYDAIIIGAGLTGLTAAFYLNKKGKKIKVIEKQPVAGGVIQTHRKNGFVFESGPNTGVLSNPEAAELLEDLDGKCKLEIADETAKRRWVWKGDDWHELPSGLVKGVKTPLFSMKDKLRIVGEPFRKPGENPDETLDEMVKRRMGKSFLNYAIDPFILGVYAGDPSYLVPRHALPKLYNLEQNYGSFIGGAVKKKKEEKSEYEKKATKDVFSIKGGLSNMIKALQEEMGSEKIILGNQHLVVTKQDQTYEVQYDDEKITASNVVFTGGSHGLRGVFDFLGKEEVETIDNLYYSKVIQVALGFKNWQGRKLNAFGGLVPYIENRDVLGVLLPSAFLSDRAPENGALLTVFLGGFRKPEMIEKSDNEIMTLVEKEVKAMMKLPEFNPDMVEIFRYEHAIPQYGKSSEERFSMIEKVQKEHPGLVLAGNMRDGIGMADRIQQGRQVADSL